MVDDCHATGFLGPKGAGRPHWRGRGQDRHPDRHLRQGARRRLGRFRLRRQGGRRPCCASARGPTSSPTRWRPSVCGASAGAIRIAAGDEGDDLRKRLARTPPTSAPAWQPGFKLLPGEHPIIPVMLGDAKLAQEWPRAARRGHLRHRLLLPGGAQGPARIRTQMSAAHEPHHIDKAISAFTKVGRELGVI